MKNRLPLVVTMLTAIPLALAVACGGDGDDGGSGGSGGSGGASGGSGGTSGGTGGTSGGTGGTSGGTGGTSDGGTTSGGTSGGGGSSGGMAGSGSGATAGLGGMGGMGGMGGNPGDASIPDACMDVCETQAAIHASDPCAYHDPDACQSSCEDDSGYLDDACAEEYRQTVACWAQVDPAFWICGDFYFGFATVAGAGCTAEETAYYECWSALP